MTIDEAIKYHEDMAEINKCAAKMLSDDAFLHMDSEYKNECRDNASKSSVACKDHRQLAEWLTELKELRNSVGAVKLKDMKEAVELLQELNTENDQLTSQLADAKWLLKSAVEDIHELLCDKKNLDGNGQSCNICSYIERCNCCKECTIREDLRNWRYADEALKLIGGRTDEEP